jgi:hypothetical protein
MKNVTFFSNTAGRVVAFPDDGIPSVAAVRLTDWEGFTATRSIITRVGFSGQANASFRHTVGGAVHIYTFGDRIGEAVVSGLCFDSGCDNNDFSAMQKIMDYFNRNRVSERAAALTLTVGGRLGLLAYLIGVTCDIAETTSRVYQYSFKLVLVPEPQKQVATQTRMDAVREAAANTAQQLQDRNEAIRNQPGRPQPPIVMTGPIDLPDDAPFVPYTTPSWGNAPTSDIGGANATAGNVPYPPTPGWVTVGTGPNTQLAQGFN